MLELGAGGELLVARMRAALCALVLLLPLLALAGGSVTGEVVAGLVGALAVNVTAQVGLALARNLRRYRWLPYASGIHDVTATTFVLLLLFFHDPVAAVNSVVVWCFYVIAIVLTALRNDGRLTLAIGGLAILQYLALSWGVLTLVPRHQLLSIDYGAASVNAVAQRLVLLLIVTTITATIVHRMQRLVELSGRDGLTGLPNRTWLLHTLPRAFSAARASGASLALGLLDLDDFKRINEETGPRGGDRAIRHVAAALEQMTEEGEHVARIGGQEFVVLLQCPLGSAWERLDRMRMHLAGRPFVPPRGDPQRLTFSAGIAAWPHDGTDASTLLGAADRRLQRAKREGRNRVVARDD